MKNQKNSDTWITNSADETFELGQILGSRFPKDLVCFYGMLGAGKTTLIKGWMAKAIDLDPNAIHSPTFVYLHIHEGTHQAFHFDLYRLESQDQFLELGFDEFLFSNHLRCIEWPEKMGHHLPSDHIAVHLDHLENSKRKIEVRYGH